MNMWFPIIINGFMSCLAYYTSVKLIPKVKDMFIKANLFGIDQSKKHRRNVYVSVCLYCAL